MKYLSHWMCWIWLVAGGFGCAESHVADRFTPLGSSKPVANSVKCNLTSEDLVANAALSFDEFDQSDKFFTNSRTLSNIGCFDEAVRATEHYLIHGPTLIQWQRDAVTWHLGQYLAVSGDELGAARLMATTRKSIDKGVALDWNSYVVGTWAFLVKDRTTLDRSIVALRAAPADNTRS